MRIIDSIPHQSMTISIFHMNDKYLVKFEAGPMEQVFKFSVEEVRGLEKLKELIDENFIEKTYLRFNDMFMQLKNLK
jgi:hypothetical protein